MRSLIRTKKKDLYDLTWYLVSVGAIVRARKGKVLLEAQDMAVKDHNVEFRSNLYLAKPTSGGGQFLKHIHYHGRGHLGIMEKVYCRYFVKMMEGPLSSREPLKIALTHTTDYIQKLRSWAIIYIL